MTVGIKTFHNSAKVGFVPASHILILGSDFCSTGIEIEVALPYPGCDYCVCVGREGDASARTGL